MAEGLAAPPETRAAARGPFVLLDRDGTINRDVGYLGDPEGVVLLPGAVAGLRTLRSLGCPLAIVTNQSGVARGRFTWARAEAVQARVLALLAEAGIEVAASALCPHGPEDGCDCRKPAPGLALAVARASGLPLEWAVVVGDKRSDIGLALRIGARSVLITPDPTRALDHGQTVVATDLVGAAIHVASWIAERAREGRG